MKHLKKIILFVVSVAILFFMLTENSLEVAAKSIYSSYSLSLNHKAICLYLDQTPAELNTLISYYRQNYSDTAYKNASDAIYKNLEWSTSNPKVVQFVTQYHYDSSGNITYDTASTVNKKKKHTGYLSPVKIIGLSQGNATIKVKSPQLKKTLTCKITVKNAELTCDDSVFYTNNNYTFFLAGNASAATFSSSNSKVASIHKTSGVMKAKKAGTTTITCISTTGTKYRYQVTVKRAGLSYKKLTSYCYTGFQKGCYNTFPLVANGIDVKKWKSSNTKICKVKSYGSVCSMQMRNTGKCTITCIAKNGKKYKCKLTVTGGKAWGGLNNGYRPTLSDLKRHGYYKDINKINDYGKVVVVIMDYDGEINLKNGNKKLKKSAINDAKLILADRYPNSTIYEVSGGDYLLFTNNERTKGDRLWVECYYVK